MLPRFILPIIFLLQLYFPSYHTLVGNNDEWPLPVASRIRQRIMDRLPSRQAPKKEICYDTLGCFEVARKRSLKKSPQSPATVDTKFWLYTRKSVQDLVPLSPDHLHRLRNVSKLISYGDNGESLHQADFDPKKPIKVLIHGFKGSGQDKGALSGAQELLKLEDVNMLIVDWEKGASDSYPTAAANTELIGRQTAVALMEMLALGAKAKNIHIIGFSLGAHIAGCAGDMLKSHGHLVGRITGLDPASPLFKNQFIRESSTKLDASDAEFVDIIHTDGSPVFTDGFGLLRPIGHVDFFPNGGREQPGCSDGRGSVVVSTLEGTINSSVACSHVRAWQLFLESVKNYQNEDGCQFIAYPCKGGSGQFGDGRCFVEEPLDRCLPGDPRCNVMGMGVSRNGALGVLYLSTRAASPFCGEQLQASVRISERTQPTRGYLHMQVTQPGLNLSTNFRFNNELDDGINGGMSLTGLAVAEKMTINSQEPVNIVVSFQSLEFQNVRPNIDVHLGDMSLRNIKGNLWHTCRGAGTLNFIPNSSFSTLITNLTVNRC